MQEVFLFEAVRTPIGRGTPRGALYEVKPLDLLSALLRYLAEELALAKAPADDLFVGCVTPTDDQGFNLAKAALLRAGWPHSVGGLTLNRYAASGLEAVNLAAARVRAGEARLMVAGGVESQSRVPAGSEGGPLIHDPSLINQSAYLPKGIAADLLATIQGFRREELDAVAERSYRFLAEAAEPPANVLPIRDQNGLVLLDRDEAAAHALSPEELVALPPAFTELGAAGFDAMAIRRFPTVESIRHVHTTGNIGARADGAALVLLGTREAGEALNLKPRARLLAAGNAGVDPTLMLTGAVPAARAALRQAEIAPEAVELWFCLESFAAVSLHFQRAFQIEEDRFNPGGGAIARGYPLGAAGAILLGDLLRQLEKRGATYGLAATAAGGGMGVATLIERLNEAP